MSILYINTGTNPNAGDGDSIRLAFTKINNNFGEVTDQISGITAPSALVAGTYTFALSTTGTVTLNGDPFVSSSSGTGNGWQLTSSTVSLSLDSSGILLLPYGGSIVSYNGGGGVDLVSSPGVDGYMGMASSNYRNWMYVNLDAAYIEASDGYTIKTWTFGQDGVLTIPGEIDSTTGTGDVVINATDGTSNSTWTFGADGVLTIPGNIESTTGTGDVVINATTGTNTGTWIFGSDGNLDAPGNLAVNGGKITLHPYGNAYIESVDYGINTSTSAVNLFAGPDQKIVLRAGFGTEQFWTFDTDGVLTIPSTVGDIKRDGVSVLGAQFDQSLNTTNDVTFSNLTVTNTASFIDVNISGLLTLGQYQGYDNLAIIKNDPDILHFTLRNLHVDSATEINLVDNISGGLTIVHQNSTAPSGDFAVGENFIYGESINDTINIGRNQDLRFFANENWTNWSSATPVLVMRKSDSSVIVNNNIYSENIIPQSDNSYDLGASTSSWNHVWLNYINDTNIHDIIDATGNGTFSTLPDFLSFFRATYLRTGQTSEGVFFSGNAGNENVSYPVRTNFPIDGTVKVVVTLDMVVNSGCSDFSVCVLDGSEGGIQPQWAWDSNPTRIAASYNCTTPHIYGLTSEISSGYDLPGDDTYRVRFTYDPNNSPNVTLETLDTSNTVLDTISLDGTLDTTKPYFIGFAADQDDTALRTYIKNLIIEVDGGATYTDSLQLSGVGGSGYQLTSSTAVVTLSENGVLTIPGDIESTTGVGDVVINATTGTNTSTWTFGTDGVLTVPGDIESTTGVGDVVINATDGSTTGTWTFGADSNLTVPGDILAQEGNDLNFTVYNPTLGGVSIQFVNRDIDSGQKTTQFNIAPTDITLTTDFNGARNNWTFDTDGVLTVPGSIIPDGDKLYDLGSTSSQWRSLYVSTNTIYIGGVPLSLDSSTSLTINGNPVVTYNSTSGNFSAGGASVQGSGVYESNIPPDNTNLLWYDTVSGRLYIYYDSSWVDASPGAIGPSGPQGPSGPSGANGAQGPSGAAGANGARGPQGPSGVNGPQGPSGAAGSNGAQGPQGPSGVNGPQGPSGAAGSNGAQGPQGPSGAAGSNGAQGPQGPSGAAGPTGPMGLFTATGNIIGTLTNVTLVAGSYSYTFENTGSLILPAVGDNEGGEIDFGKAPNSTLTGTNVVIDQYVDRFRFFEAGGTTRGAYIDLSQAAAGVGTLLNNRVSGIVNSGTFVTMDLLKATVTTSGNRGLSLAATTGLFSIYIGGNYATNGGANGSAGGATITTSASASQFNWNFVGAGDISTYVITDITNNRAYRITLQIGGGYLNNMISIERLV